MKELVNHPKHYQDVSGKECIDYMMDYWGPLCVIIFCTLNAFKYRFRRGKKEGNPIEQDSKKAEWYDSYAYNIYIKLHGMKKLIARWVLFKRR